MSWIYYVCCLLFSDFFLLVSISCSAFKPQDRMSINICICICIYLSDAGRSLGWRRNVSARSTGSRDLLQWAVGSQQQRKAQAVRAKGRCCSIMCPVMRKKSVQGMSGFSRNLGNRWTMDQTEVLYIWKRSGKHSEYCNCLYIAQ